MTQINCKSCNNIFTPSKGFVNFCSLVCRNKRNTSKESKLLVSEKIKNLWASGHYSKTDWAKINNDKERIKKVSFTWNKKLEDRIEKGEKIHIHTIRNILKKIRGYKCGVCKISDWLNEKLTLECHHIDGNNKNNKLSNLIILCPNCHSQTDNYRNKKTKK